MLDQWPVCLPKSKLCQYQQKNTRKQKLIFSCSTLFHKKTRAFLKYFVHGCRFQVCENVKEPDTFTIFTTKNTFKINDSFNCNDKCLIYLFSCKTFGKQYTGKTTDHFRSRWNNYKSELEQLRVVTWKMLSKSSYRVIFYNQIRRAFLKAWKLG